MPHLREGNVADQVLDLIPALRAYALSLTKNRPNAEDLVQETLLKAFSNIDKFQPGTMLRAWLFTIMRNTFFTSVKISAREVTGAADCVSLHAVVPANQEWALRGREVIDAINHLPPHHRDMLILVVLLGESYEDAAARCNCAIGTVKSRVNRGRRMVVQYLGEDAGPISA